MVRSVISTSGQRISGVGADGKPARASCTPNPTATARSSVRSFSAISETSSLTHSNEAFGNTALTMSRSIPFLFEIGFSRVYPAQYA